jgi:F420-non-reducing hydrogenase iron-sulfur subunit
MIERGATRASLGQDQHRLSGMGGVVVVFVCEHSGRAGRAPSSGLRPRPSQPAFDWPFPVQEVAVPCAGRLQPEHFLKALEGGADAVGVICCAEENCHQHDGSRRCRRRLDYVGGLIEQAGLSKDRLLLCHLPGSAAQDVALGAGGASAAATDMTEQTTAVREAFVAALAKVSRNPLGIGDLPDESPYEVDSEDESDE